MAPLAGLSAPVTVARDALGVPTVRAENRRDVARAVGWLHAQDRFFQMDLMRRSSAGELAEIFGERALPRDRAIRMHGFRKLAELVIARLPPHERAIVDAYAAGVNAGLGALSERPFEYVVLRATPQPWRPEDSILVIYAMTIDLQNETGRYERTLMTLRDQLGPEGLAFFAPLTAPDDAALDGSTAPLPPIPGPKTIDLRARQTAAIAPLPVVGGASGMGILPMSDGLAQTHGRDARATSGIQTPPTSGRYALPRLRQPPEPGLGF
jgi:penicillin amidase